MRLQVVDALCEAAGAHNEDTWGQAGDAVWVLDGATGIGARPYLGGPTDAAWFVRQVSPVLAAAFADQTATRDAVAFAAQRAAEAARTHYDIDALPGFELPTASLNLVRAVGDEVVEFGNLGDCRLVHRTADGAVESFGTCNVAALEARIHVQIARDFARGLAPEEVRRAGMAVARENRKLMNTPEGYWILDPSGTGAPHTEVERVAPGAPMDILLMSDGFSRLVDIYGVYDDDALMRAALRSGLAGLYSELRAIEAGDPECRTYTRLNARDDATAVLLRFA